MKRKSFAMMVTMWFSAILMLSVIYLLSIYKKSVNRAFNLQEKLKVDLQTHSILEKIKFSILTGEKTPFYIKTDKEVLPKDLAIAKEQNLSDGNFSLYIRPSGNMISLYNTNGLLLENMIKSFSNNNDNFQNPFLDWIDLDNNSLLDGAENNYYFLNQKKYSSSDRGAIQHPEELFLIKNYHKIDSKTKEFIISNFHFGTVNKINPKYIPPNSLKRFVFLDDFTLAQLKELFTNDSEKYASSVATLLREKTGEESAMSYPNYYQITLQGIFNQGKIKLITEFAIANTSEKPITIYQYKIPL